MKKILLPTDFSKVSENAIRYAFEMFGGDVYKDDVQFLLLFDYYPAPPPPSYGGPIINDDAKLIIQMDKNLKERCEKWKAEYPNVNIEEKFTTGGIKDAIRHIAKKEKADLIVMGTTGKSGMERALMGSVAAGIAQQAPCPVLVVPHHAQFVPPNRIVFATDFNNLEDLTILDNLRNIIHTYDPEFYMLHVYREKETSKKERENMDRILKVYFDSENYHRYFLEHDNPAEGIEEFIKGHNSDMLALVGQERNFFERLFHKSVTKQVVTHTEIPLFVLQKPRIIEREDIPFREIAQEQIDYWKAEAEDLQVQLHLARADAGDVMKKTEKEIRERLKWLWRQIDKAEDVAESNWKHFTKDVSESLKNLEHMVRKQ